MKVYDLFAGPGGWDMGARTLGLDPIGFEWDDAACATRRAVGLKTMQCDVAAVDFASGFDPDGLWGLIASPPCQAWSMAGKGGGQRDKEHVVACAMELAAGNDTRAEHAALCEDPRSILVVEPLRWALHFRPRWIAFEQVPPVLELWTLFAQILSDQGYSTWAGVLEAERYGVPQTRERAILMGSLDGPVEPPRATHQRYVKGEPPRHDVTFDGEILPWVSMAEALGWTEGHAPRPAPTVTGGGGSHGGVEVFASKSARESARASVAYDRRQGCTNPETGVRTMARPIPVDEPAPTIAAEGLAKGRDVWTVMAKKEDRPERKAQGAGNTPRPVTDPAATLDTRTDLAHWVNDRPSTTVRANSNEITAPTYTDRDPTWTPGDPEPSQATGAVRVTVEEASILQTFPPDYPWQGSRTKQFEQIGNAVPPMLAAAVLGALVPADEKRIAA